MEKVSDVILYKHRTMINGLVKRIAITASFVVLAFASVLYSSCKKETNTVVTDAKCATVVCQNNGSCMGGVCYCVAGYEGDYCEKASVNRYVGKWDVQETVSGSTKGGNVGAKRYFVMDIKKGKMALDILFDNFMEEGYDNIPGVISRKYVGTAVDVDAPTSFIFTANQTITGTYKTINRGAGKINDIGTEITGWYIVTYLENRVQNTDSVVFVASIMQ
ncbi:MAG TPA: calcium-binding EGF-like domain-containing protein [Flavipsychrobacter sp.]|nr:calcium-binding EGF-like domain-containing protein [Flavipsychrobacter sp.]